MSPYGGFIAMSIKKNKLWMKLLHCLFEIVPCCLGFLQISHVNISHLDCYTHYGF